MPELYFLRSSEQFIVEDILSHTDRAESKIYYEFFGYREGDMGVYLLEKGEVVGAAWVRLLKDSLAFVDEQTPELSIVVKNEHRKQAYATKMMQQLIYEVAGLYKQMSLSIGVNNSAAITLSQKLGFTKVENLSSEKTHTMLKVFDGSERSSIKQESTLPSKYDEYTIKSYF